MIRIKPTVIGIIGLFLMTSIVNVSALELQNDVLEPIVYVSSDEAQSFIDLNDVIILDVREEYEFGMSHIFEAINIPLNELEDGLDRLGASDQNILVYCSAGSRSEVASQVLVMNGFYHIYNLENGLAEYAETYPIYALTHSIHIEDGNKVYVNPIILGATSYCEEEDNIIGEIPLEVIDMEAVVNYSTMLYEQENEVTSVHVMLHKLFYLGEHLTDLVIFQQTIRAENHVYNLLIKVFDQKMSLELSFFNDFEDVTMEAIVIEKEQLLTSQLKDISKACKILSTEYLEMGENIFWRNYGIIADELTQFRKLIKKNDLDVITKTGRGTILDRFIVDDGGGGTPPPPEWDDDPVITEEPIDIDEDGEYDGTLIQTYYPHATFEDNQWNWSAFTCALMIAFCMIDLFAIVLCVAAVIATAGVGIPACVILFVLIAYSTIRDCFGVVCCTGLSEGACAITYDYVSYDVI